MTASPKTVYSGELTVDLDALAFNWRQMSALTAGECAAVVKADAYGLGVAQVAPLFFAQGCRVFFVANLDEAVHLQGLLPADAIIYVLGGCAPGEEMEFVRRALRPVLSSLAMLKRWSSLPVKGHKYCALKFNTGMNRLGLDVSEFEVLLSEPSLVAHAGVCLVLSHMACADSPGHPLNDLQRQAFEQLRKRWLAQSGFPSVKFSLANSAAILLGERFHYDLLRPGIALYSGAFWLSQFSLAQDVSLKPVVALSLPILQVRRLSASAAVGYGATATLHEGAVVAVVAGGYADGLVRTMSNRIQGCYAGQVVPQVGRVSMDSMAFDVSAIVNVQTLLHDWQGQVIQVLGGRVNITEQAIQSQTIDYELLTSLGRRYRRRYLSC